MCSCNALRLQRFCCCCTTKTGSLVIGTAGWVLTLIEIIGLVTLKTHSTTEEKKINTTDDDDEINLFESDKSDLAYEIGSAVVTFIVCALLIWGIYKRDKRFMLPWLVSKCIENVLGLLATLFIFTLACIVSEEAAVLVGFGVVMLVIVGLFFYAWVCVWSHYLELSEGVAPPVYYYPTSEHAQIPPQKGSQMI